MDTAVEEGNFIYVYPAEQIAEAASIANQNHRALLSERDGCDRGRPPLLSEAGKVVPLGEVEEGFNPDEIKNGTDSYAYTAKIVVTDYPDRLEKVVEIGVNSTSPSSHGRRFCRPRSTRAMPSGSISRSSAI